MASHCSARHRCYIIPNMFAGVGGVSRPQPLRVAALHQRAFAARPPRVPAAAPACTSVDSAAPEKQQPKQPSPHGPLEQAPPTGSSADSLPPERLKQLRTLGLAIKDKIKMGRRGVCESLSRQIHQRWNTSEVARLYCDGKHGDNMKELTQQLEEVTGGIVVFRSGRSVWIYRGDGWKPRPQPPLRPSRQRLAEQREQQQAQQEGGGEEQQQQEGERPVQRQHVKQQPHTQQQRGEQRQPARQQQQQGQKKKGGSAPLPWW